LEPLKTTHKDKAFFPLAPASAGVFLFFSFALYSTFEEVKAGGDSWG
jgi:hypothetical protein